MPLTMAGTAKDRESLAEAGTRGTTQDRPPSVMMEVMNRSELAEFLRNRRARVTPREVGLPEGDRRRTPGLRRQEVAQLAGMSIDYYIRLEQGRGPRPSHQVLGALGRALLLTADERAHLYNLAGDPPAPGGRPPKDVPRGILNLLSVLEDIPAYVLDARYDILAWNDLAGIVMGGLNSGSGGGFNVIRWIFGSPDVRANLEDEEKGRFARASVADLRAATGRYPGDAGIRSLVAEMLARSPEFAGLWAAHDVAIRRDHRKSLTHPLIGTIEVVCQVLPVPDRDQRLVLYTTEAGSPSHDALRMLGMLQRSPSR
ncbi:transcriptional regulator with XRE-family HTH domain [Streptosporangium lutulentum]|uniref:Transcriptional regulator with XRE-family HTH domain n=2 Tax=Streptosporangium lutulentum TaxID=1461250 RepID=A0ABT9Q4J0_9ACTN|nr:helix-turn-helix transcriptional regulator [Streptosporangium lutulentum]MDP9841646.1 transcriptional regulator with XRE-family HTH domain [Streptosporangium lutulentum]